MKSKLEIDTTLIPEEGLALCGELDGILFELTKNDAKSISPLHYDLFVQCFENEILLQGSLEAAFQFQCVVTNQTFLKTIFIEQSAIALELSGSVMDVTEALREEVLIEFPAHPRCDQADEPMPCEVNPRYLAVDKPTDDGVNPASQTRSNSDWNTLDQLGDLPDHPESAQ